MKILQIAPIFIPLKPDMNYGGIERVVLALGRTFSKKNCEVITAAPKDATFQYDKNNNYGSLLPTLDVSEWTKSRIESSNPNAYENHVEKVIDFLDSEKVDIVHDHTGNFVLSDTFKDKVDRFDVLKNIPIIVTPHEFQRFKKIAPPNQDNIFFTSLSEFQKKVFSPYVDIKKVINNGVFVEDYSFNSGGDYLFSIGSIEPAKGQDIAIRVSKETGLPLKIAGPVSDQEFYDLEIKPYFGKDVQLVGSLDDKRKIDFYAGARAMLAPIRIGDCFSLVRIESLACGTPCVTLDVGSANEAIKHGKTGYLVNYNEKDESLAIDGMVKSVRDIDKISSRACRDDVEQRFSWDKIADKYLEFYQNVI